MNVTEKIFALALASNFNPQQHFTFAFSQLCRRGEVKFSAIYQIPCRDGIGATYWNSACLLYSDASVAEMMQWAKQLEQQSGRVRPSHQISLDVDVIAWGSQLSNMQFNLKKMPLAQDVKIPMADLWQHALFRDAMQGYPTIAWQSFLQMQALEVS